MNLKINITDYLQRQSKPVLALLGTGLLVVVALAQYKAGWELSFSVFYLLPVSYFAWFFSRSSGVLVSMMSAVVSLAITLIQKPPYSSSAISDLNNILNLALFLVLVHITGELRELYLKEQRQSHRDSLTGLANQRAFLETLSAEVERAKRYGLTTTLAYLDADNFKKVNDSFNHETGDQLLIMIADTIRSNLRNVDSLARLGGDEFCILMPQTDSAAADLVLNKIQDLLFEKMQRHDWPVTFSIGAVTYLQPPASPEEMIRQADVAMYSAKANGKNQIVLTTCPIQSEASHIQA